MKMRRALITGATGQDGSYLAESLLDQGWEVVGAVRDPGRDASRLVPALAGRIELVEWRTDGVAPIMDAFRAARPDAVFNFAARSSGAEMHVDPVAMTEINGVAVVRILEAIRTLDRRIRFCQASSSEMFGDAAESPQSESTCFRPRSPYGAAKLLAHSMIGIQRQRHGLFACSAILFNHESPRRGREFVTRKIADAAVRIKLGLQDELKLGNLDAKRDWGYAPDYVQAMQRMLEHDVAGDYVIATGVLHTVRQFCERAFSRVGLEYSRYVSEDPAAFRPLESVSLVGNAGKARRDLGWQARATFDEIVDVMVDAALAQYDNPPEAA